MKDAPSTLTFWNAPRAKAACVCSRCSPKTMRSGATCAASARRPSCQRKGRQGRLRIGHRARSEDESSVTKPRKSVRPPQTRKQRAKANVCPKHQNPNPFHSNSSYSESIQSYPRREPRSSHDSHSAA
jgi:hypothetical protein